MEAVENFEGPDYWKGFESCFLCVVTSEIYNPRCRMPGRLGYGSADLSQIGNRCLYWLRRAERAVPRDHEHWPLVRLKVLFVQVEFLTWFDRVDLGHRVFGKVLTEVRQIDLQLQFDFPVPLPDIQYLKSEILELLAERRITGWQLNELVPEIGPEVLKSDSVAGSHSQARYALSCLVLRGQQLIAHFGQVEKGLEVFATCLAVAYVFGHHVGRQLEGRIIRSCCATIGSDLADMVVDLDRVNKIQEFLVAQGRSLLPTSLANSFIRKVWAVCGFSGPATFMPSVVPALSPSKAVLEAFWESYKHSCAALTLSIGMERSYGARHNGKVHISSSWVPDYLLFTIHAVAATVSKLLAPNAEAPADGEIARQALLSLESGRNDKRKEIWSHIHWKWMERAHRACGPGAVFVQFAGGFQRLDSAKGLGMSDVCIVVQDEGVASCHRLERIDPDSILENVREISAACLKRNLESDCCRNALETLYDLLIKPLFHSFIREGNWNPHRKLVISAVGCFQDVPFSILRNKDSGCYLFQEAKLAFTPSFLVLHFCQLRYESLQERTLLAGAGAAVALGDPQYLPYEDTPLPGSRKEVDAICELFDFCRCDHEIVKLLDADATVERLLEWVKKPSGVGSGTQCSQAFIHIAAHGSGGNEANHGTVRLASAAIRSRRRRRAQGKVMRDEDEPASSAEESYYEPEASVSSDALHFRHHMLQHLEAFESDSSGAEGLDRILPRLLRGFRSSDVGTRLRCDDVMLSGSEWCAYLVVLSACDTAVGVTLHSNELDVLSFSRAFMNAGVPCSVLAQWRVDDSAALHLMVLFYEALSRGEDACSALQSAMIKMHQAGKYTLHQIAPFVVTGLPTVCLPPQMRRGPALELASSIS